MSSRLETCPNPVPPRSLCIRWNISGQSALEISDLHQSIGYFFSADPDELDYYNKSTFDHADFAKDKIVGLELLD